MFFHRINLSNKKKREGEPDKLVLAEDHVWPKPRFFFRSEITVYKMFFWQNEWNEKSHSKGSDEIQRGTPPQKKKKLPFVTF